MKNRIILRGSTIDPSTKPSLFFTVRDKIIARLQEAKLSSERACETRTRPGPSEGSENKDLIKRVGRGLLGFAAAVNTVQRTLVETCGLIRETFDLKLQQTMVEMFPLRSEGAAYNKIKGMLSTVGDPFTRIISPKEYRSFRIESDGNLQGVGLFINVEPQTGHMVFLLCIENSPAERAGIREGDELMEINGARLAGVASEAAAQKLRGHVGTTVTVKVHTVDDFGSSYIREVNIPREVIKLSPISSAIIPHKLPDGHLSKTGYVKLATFSQTAALEMENTVHEMESQGVQSYILDLRNNPGGLVKAGFDVAQIWLDGTETLVNTIDTDGNMLPIDMIDGHALTRDPLVVL
ncbi:hypothetical protein MIMGU_mgv1a021298mg, partial [Erythranthe guttata]